MSDSQYQETMNNILNSPILGYVGAFTAAIFFGSNYVVTKKFPLGDGFAFQWFMSMGILIIGYICLFISGNPIWVMPGFIGGALWAIGNSMVPTAIRLVGLGISFLLWSIISLLIGWSTGKWGWFGVVPTQVQHNYINDLGPLFGIGSMIVYVLIKPTLETPSTQVINENEDEINKEEYEFSENDYGTKGSGSGSIGSGLSDTNSLSKYVTSSCPFFLAKYGRQILGAGMALGAGTLYGFCLIPFQLWYQNEVANTPEGAEPNFNPLMYAVSHYSGIFLTSSLIFVAYCIVKRNRPEVFSVSIIPSMVSGMMWGIAQAGWLITNATLGMIIGYPIVVVGPMVINSMWAVLLFKEISGKKNLSLLAVALSLNILCVFCTVISSISFSF